MAIDMLGDPDGFRKSAERLERALAGIAGGDSPTVRLAALELERAIKLELSKPGTGRIYPSKRNKRKFHQASAPGEPPAVDTGRLRNSIGHETVGGVMRVGTNVEYAAPLEYGEHRDDGTYLAPRPFMRPALAQVKDKLTGIVVEDLRRRGPGA